jgi:hypothetical protein
MQRQKIEPGLALGIAGQVSIGLTPGDKQAERQHMALVVIGMMLRQASDSPYVEEALRLAERSRIEGTQGGYRIIPETPEKAGEEPPG